MSDDRDESVWPPGPFSEQFREASGQAMDRQTELLRQMMSGGVSGLSGFSQLGAMSRTMATFKTRVQSGGRISVPDAEREALDIGEGDIVQTIVIPIKRDDESQ